MLKYNKKSLAKLGDKNPMWKGDNVGYDKLHDWVRNRLVKPTECNLCGSSRPLDLANKGTHRKAATYTRELHNWFWLCRKCHARYDNRLEKFLSYRKSFQKGNKLHLMVKNRPYGDNHKGSKISDAQVIVIRDKYKTGNYTQKQLADEYGVCFQNISLIVNNKTRKEVN